MNLVEKIKEIKKYVMNKFNITNKCLVQIYGELCGGFYRHPDVEKVKAKRIIERIWKRSQYSKHGYGRNGYVPIVKAKIKEKCGHLTYYLIKYFGCKKVYRMAAMQPEFWEDNNNER